MLNLKVVTQFKKDFKAYRYNKVVIEEFEKVVQFLLEEKSLPQKYLDHLLCGNYKRMRECHVKQMHY